LADHPLPVVCTVDPPLRLDSAVHRRFALAVRLRRDHMADGADAPTPLAWLMERGGGPGGATERRLPRGRGLWQHHHRQS
jgi:hypothetical protein